MAKRKIFALPGERYGRLVVVGDDGYRGSAPLVKCKCDCGNECSIRVYHLHIGKTKSCGCWAIDSGKRNRRHGLSKHRVFKIWSCIMQRCTNKNSTQWRHYGGRGISVCERWKTFSNFLADMGMPGPNQEIDRIDNDGDYYKENCRWVSHLENSRNRRTSKRITFKGETKTLQEWADIHGIQYKTLHARIFRYKLPLEEALQANMRNGNL
jgi:hypothetical protein